MEQEYQVPEISPARKILARVEDNLDYEDFPEEGEVILKYQSQIVEDIDKIIEIFLVIKRDNSGGQIQRFKIEQQICKEGSDVYKVENEEIKFKILEEGCEVWFEARFKQEESAEQNNSETVAESKHFWMRYFPWQKFDYFLEKVLNSGKVWYGPGAGVYDNGRWIVTSGPWTQDKPRGRTWCANYENEIEHEVVRPSFLCHTFVGFFLGYWYNYNEDYSPNWGPGGEMDLMLDADSNDPQNRRKWSEWVEKIDPPNAFIQYEEEQEAYSWQNRITGNQIIFRPRYFNNKKNFLPTELFASQHLMGVINAVYEAWEKNGLQSGHGMIIYKREGKLLRIAADAGARKPAECPNSCPDKKAPEHDKSNCNLCHAELLCYQTNKLSFKELDFDWFQRKEETDNYRTRDEFLNNIANKSHRMVNWRLKPLNEDQRNYSEIILETEENNY